MYLTKPTRFIGTFRSSIHHIRKLSTTQPLLSVFELNNEFVDSFASKSPPFGFNGLGEFVYMRTYSRTLESGAKEQWYQTVQRVVNGTYTMQKEWMEKTGMPWDETSAQEEAQDMFTRMFEMKFLPPGRGLWAMGTALTRKRKLYAALNNCAFVSTEDLKQDPTGPFCFLMDASMLGVGVGFDTLGAGTLTIRHLESDSSSSSQSHQRPTETSPPLNHTVSGTSTGHDSSSSQETSEKMHHVHTSSCSDSCGHTHHKPSRTRSFTHPAIITHNYNETFVVPDSREGWVQSLRILLDAFLNEDSKAHAVPTFDYSQIRPAGVPIKGFGGTSQGPNILKDMHQSIISILLESSGKPLSVTHIVDIMNIIGKCVVSGNVRRTAEIAFGDPFSDEYISLKDYKVNPHREAYGWTSNNSVFASLGMDYGGVCDKVKINGEPGFAWLENMRAYSRMGDEANNLDERATGGNPCLEQTLESYEMCCLVETFPVRHTSMDDYMETLKVALTYAKSVTLGPTHWPQSNAIMLRNRRIGASMSGIAQFIAQQGIHELKNWCDAGYNHIQQVDNQLSERFGVPLSIKTTSIKPSGTVSLLAGATPGMHFPESRFYLRRVRLSRDSELIAPLQEAGYSIEPAVGDENTVVVSFPVDAGEGVRTLDDVSMWEQLGIAAFLQKYWADNQVSCTVTFDPEKEGDQLRHALDLYQYQLKGVSFLPRVNKKFSSSDTSNAYAQMPYESISHEIYISELSKIRPLDLKSYVMSHRVDDNEVPDKFCDAAGCSLEGSDTVNPIP